MHKFTFYCEMVIFIIYVYDIIYTYKYNFTVIAKV